MAVVSAIVVASIAVAQTFQIIIEWGAGCQVYLGHCGVQCGKTIKHCFYCCRDSCISCNSSRPWPCLTAYSMQARFMALLVSLTRTTICDACATKMTLDVKQLSDVAASCLIKPCLIELQGLVKSNKIYGTLIQENILGYYEGTMLRPRWCLSANPRCLGLIERGLYLSGVSARSISHWLVTAKSSQPLVVNLL